MDANLEFTGRIIEVCYETNRAIVRFEGLPPEIGNDVLVVEKDGKPPAGLTEREEFIWRLGFSAGSEVNPHAELDRKALIKIDEWAKAYPLDVFPEPDLKRAHEVLEAAGLSLGAISAYAMRHVLSGIQKITQSAADPFP